MQVRGVRRIWYWNLGYSTQSNTSEFNNIRSSCYLLGNDRHVDIKCGFSDQHLSILKYLALYNTPHISLFLTSSQNTYSFWLILLSWIKCNSRFQLLSLWNRKGTQWATWGLIWSLWVSNGLKWTHFEWPYFAVAKMGLNWSQSVSFWVATTKLHPQRAQMVSFWVTPYCKA